MSTRSPKRCVLCGRVLPNGGSQVDLRLRFSDLRLRLTWCLEPCASTDAIHLDLATALWRDDDVGAQAAASALLDALTERHQGRQLQAVCESIGIRPKEQK